MLNSLKFKWSNLEKRNFRKTKNNRLHREGIYTWMWYSSMNAKFFTSSVVLGRPQTFLCNTNIWCLTWKILRKLWLHTFSVTSTQLSKSSQDKKNSILTQMPRINTIILVCHAGNCTIKLMQCISKKYNTLTDALIIERNIYLASNKKIMYLLFHTEIR